jgi:hypothetical protein
MRYPALIFFSIAFGVEEAIVVLYVRALAPAGAIIVPHGQYVLEMLRESATLIAVGAVAWLAASSAWERVRAFLFAFGLWDIVYYLALWMLSGYPTLTTNDVLFLVPVPWTAPVWAPVAFASALIMLGIFGIEPRRSVMLVFGLFLGLVSFIVSGGAYPVWLFLIAFACVLSALPLPSLRRARA